MKLYPIFSSNLVECKFDENDSVIDQLVNLSKNSEYIDSKQHGSNGSTATVDKKILNGHPKIKECLLKYFQKVNDSAFYYPCEFAITTSWFTRVTKGAFSQFHSHRNSLFSGVLYFGDYPEENTHGPIEFESPCSELPSHYVVPKIWNIHNCYSWSVYPRKNMLLFFPSYLRHRIGKHNDDTVRYSLAFNIVPIGEYGEGDSFYDTKWFNLQTLTK
jgi:uncharacterized protein (TIGR02466 family)